MKRYIGEHSLHWLSRPLCRQYFYGYFIAVQVSSGNSGASQKVAIHAGLGCRDDGEFELLGVWSRAGIGLEPQPAIFEELKARGVERIRFVVWDAQSPSVDAAREMPFGATTLPSLAQVVAASIEQVVPRHRRKVAAALRGMAAAGELGAAHAALSLFESGLLGHRYPALVEQWRVALTRWEPLFELPARLRRVLAAGDRRARLLHADLVRTLDRRGSFADEAEALAFVADALVRAGRRLDRDHGVPTAANLPVRSETVGRRSLGSGIRGLAAGCSGAFR